MATRRLSALSDAAHRELVHNILPFWRRYAVDEQHGGFHGQLDAGLLPDPSAPRSAVLYTRLLWTFSEAYLALQDPALLALADRAYQYLLAHFWDKRHGGVYWSVDHRGAVVHVKKQVYAQAFAIYACAAYARAAGSGEAIDVAKGLFLLIEQTAWDTTWGGYEEAFDARWGQLEDVRLSDKDINARKGMNTHLHLLEAYTSLYQVWPDERVKAALEVLIDLFLNRIIQPGHDTLTLYFTASWEPVTQVVSFGHDIEASWLLTETLHALNDQEHRASVEHVALRLVDAALKHGVAPDGSLYYERQATGHLDRDRHWWPQAEAVVGFLNAYQLTGVGAYLDAAEHTWRYVVAFVVDPEGGEWHARLDGQGRPYDSEPKLGPWKGPYHNARACLEVMARVAALQATEKV